MCCFHVGIAQKRGGGGGCKGLPGGLEHFFPTLARGCKCLPGWFGALFFLHICPFDRGGGCLKIFGQCPYRTNTFQNGAFLRIVFFLLETRLANQSNACFLVLSAGICICILLHEFVIGHPLLPLNNYVCSSFHFLIPQAVARLSTNKPGI